MTLKKCATLYNAQKCGKFTYNIYNCRHDSPMKKKTMSKICVEEFFLLRTVSTVIDNICPSYKSKRQTPWVSKEKAMKMLCITSATTLQKLRDEGAIEFSKLGNKSILYLESSILEFIESKAVKRF